MNNNNKRSKKPLAFILLTAMLIFVLPMIASATPTVSITSPPTAANLTFAAAGTNTWIAAQGTDPDGSIGQVTITFDSDIEKSTASDVKVRAYGGVDGTTLLTLINESNIQGILFGFGDGTADNVLTKNVNSTYAQAIATVNANVDESETVTKVEFDIYDEGSDTDPLTISLILTPPGMDIPKSVEGYVQLNLKDISKKVGGVTVSIGKTVSGVYTETVKTTVTADDGYFELPAIPDGSYDMRFSAAGYLMREVTGIAVTSGQKVTVSNASSPIVLWGGNLNDSIDNAVNATDLSILLASFNKTEGTPGYSDVANLNNDTAVNATDLSIMLGNFNKTGANYPVYTLP